MMSKTWRVHQHTQRFSICPFIVMLALLLPLLPNAVAAPISPSEANVFAPRSKQHMVAAATPICPAGLSFGEKIQCSIQTGGEHDTYTFTANPNDVVLIRMIRTSGTFEPEFKIFGSDGAEICGNYGAPLTGKTCTLNAGGTYTLQAFESFGRLNTGEYTLYLQRLNNPGGAQPIAFAETTAGSVAVGGDMRTYTFNAAANDTVLTRMIRTSGLFEPEFKIYNARGTEVCGSYGAPVTGTTCKFADTNTYTLLAFESFSRLNSGDYTLYLQRLNNPSATRAIAFGEALSGAIDVGGKIESYSFTATANDKVLVRVVRTTGSFEPEFKIYNARGIEVCGNYGAPVTGNTCTLVDSAAYTLLMFESFSRLNTGAYRLYLQRLNNPGGVRPISFGQTIADAIEVGGAFDTYTFSAIANDRILVRMVQVSGVFEPEFKIFDARGNQACGNYGAPVSGTICQLHFSEQYTLLAFESFSRLNTGDYRLYLQRLNNPGSVTSLASGQTVSGTIGVGGEFDTFTFRAVSNAKILLRMTRTAGIFEPELKVFDPTGVEICGAYSAPVAQISSCTLPLDGTYTVLAFESFSRLNTGSYSLYLTCLSSTCAAAPSALSVTLFTSDKFATQRGCYEVLVAVRNNGEQPVSQIVTLRESAQYQRFTKALIALPAGRADTSYDCDTNTALTTGGTISRSGVIPAKGVQVYRFRLRHDWDWIRRPSLVSEVLHLVVNSALGELGKIAGGHIGAAVIKSAIKSESFLGKVEDVLEALPRANYTYTIETDGLGASAAETVSAEVSSWQIGYLRGSVTSSLESLLTCPLSFTGVFAPACAAATAATITFYFAAYDPQLHIIPLSRQPDLSPNALGYTELVEPSPIVLQEIEAIADPQQRAFAQQYLSAIAFRRAALASLAHASEAAVANDSAWILIQRERAQRFTKQERDALASAASVGQTALTSIPPLNVNQAQQLQDQIVTSGFEPTFTAIMHDLALSDNEINELRNAIGMLNAGDWVAPLDSLIGNQQHRSALDTIADDILVGVRVPLVRR